MRSLSGDDVGHIVASCPAWTAKDVLAHLSGLVSDILAGVRPPLGTEEMTARQVDERRDLSHQAICDEWVGNGPAIADVFADNGLYALGLTADLAVHVHDLAESLDGISAPPTEATRAGCDRYVPLLQERAAEHLDVALSVDIDGQIWAPAGGTKPLALATTAVDFLRSVTGRRTRAQVEAMSWDGDSADLLEAAFTQYGPYRGASDS